MHILATVSAVLALALYIPLCWQIWTGKVNQSLATFILWGLLDGIAAVAAYREGGNWFLPAFYTIGCLAVIACLLKARSIVWGMLETIISVMVLICIVAWIKTGNDTAIVISSLALAIASSPQLVDAWKAPAKVPLLTYVGFTVANVLATLAGKDWSIAERFYPGIAALTTLAFVALAARKWFVPKQ